VLIFISTVSAGGNSMRWLVVPFLRFADFKGRSGRTEFWVFFGLSVAALILTAVATGLSTDTSVVAQPKAPGANASPAGAIGYMLWWLASIVPWFAVQVRRFHDQGRSGWLCLIGVGGYVAVGFGAMPVAGILFLAAMALMALPGQETENRFGLPINAGEDFEMAPVESEALPPYSQFYNFNAVAVPPYKAQFSLDPNLEVAEPQQETPKAWSFIDAHTESSIDQDTSSNWPSSVIATNTKHHTTGPEHSILPADVKPEANGRFSCGGYTFNSLQQALFFAKCRNERVGNVERSVFPSSYVPAPTPQQPTQLKLERSGFLGFVSSVKKQTVAEHWVATPTNLSAGGVPFEGHLVYFGSRPRSQQYECNRSLIEPNLEVSNGRDPQGSTFSYWPNYSELRPEARRSYLEWLSSGRSNPATPIG
jgi:uncharacterized membrane protein YhaH (DUF805 family)